MKPGWKTTEFWIALLAIVGAATASLAGLLPPVWAALVTLISTLAYIATRALTKHDASGAAIMQVVLEAAPAVATFAAALHAAQSGKAQGPAAGGMPALSPPDGSTPLTAPTTRGTVPGTAAAGTAPVVVATPNVLGPR